MKNRTMVIEIGTQNGHNDAIWLIFAVERSGLHETYLGLSARSRIIFGSVQVIVYYGVS